MLDIFFYIYLENISVTGQGLDDGQSLELSSQQCQHAAVDVIQADAWRTQGQAGALHLQHGLVQLGLRRAESAKGGTWEAAHRQSDVPKNDSKQMNVSNLLSVHRPRAGDIADVTKIFATPIEQNHFTVLAEERKRQRLELC